MICGNCGNEIRDDAKFCPHCGQMSGPDMAGGLPQGTASYSPSGYTGPEAPVPGGGKKGLIIGGVVAAIAVIAILAVVVSGMLAPARWRRPWSKPARPTLRRRRPLACLT